MPHNPLRDPAEALRFVVDFVQLDLAQLSRQDVERLERRVRFFVAREESFLHADPFPTTRRPAPNTWEKLGLLGLTNLQRFARVSMGSIAMENQPQRFAFASVKSLTFWAMRQASGRIEIAVGGSILDRFLYQMIRVIQQVGVERLRTCPDPECRRTFVKVTRKRFCSTKCQSRVYMRKYRSGEVGGQ